MKYLRSAAALTMLLLASVALPRRAHGTTTINVPNTGGGVASAADLGQAFTVPVGPDTRLDSFQVYGSGAAGNVTFDASDYEFNSTTDKTIGPALYTSGVQVAENGFNVPEMTFSFATGGIELVAGQQYLLDLHQEGFGNVGNLEMASSNTPYSGGDFYVYNSSLQDWSRPGGSNPFGPMAFEAVLNAPGSASVPLPGSGPALLGMILLALVCAVVRYIASRVSARDENGRITTPPPLLSLPID